MATAPQHERVQTFVKVWKCMNDVWRQQFLDITQIYLKDVCVAMGNHTKLWRRQWCHFHSVVKLASTLSGIQCIVWKLCCTQHLTVVIWLSLIVPELTSVHWHILRAQQLFFQCGKHVKTSSSLFAACGMASLCVCKCQICMSQLDLSSPRHIWPFPKLLGHIVPKNGCVQESCLYEVKYMFFSTVKGCRPGVFSRDAFHILSYNLVPSHVHTIAGILKELSCRQNKYLEKNFLLNNFRERENFRKRKNWEKKYWKSRQSVKTSFVF